MDDVVYQGVPGAFSEEAAIALRGEDAVRTPVASFDEVCDAVVAGRARFGVLPIENTLAGSVQPVYDLLGRKDVRILGETNVRVSHVLVAVRGATRTCCRRGCVPDPTGCGSGRTPSVRWRIPSRTRPCWSCPA